jgi:hypothetical protein
MKLNLVIASTLLLALTGASFHAVAEESEPPKTTETQEAPVKDPYLDRLQKKYSLTDEQMKSLKDSKLPDSQLTKVAELAKDSGKSIDDILKMRLEQKMGWGRIAKELKVHPGELGRSVADMNHERHGDRDDRKERRENHENSKGHGHNKNK